MTFGTAPLRSFRTLAPVSAPLGLHKTMTFSPASLRSFRMTLRSFSLGLLLLSKSCFADRDNNAPWGDNPPRRFSMYWKDPGNVLEDIDEFSSLYIKAHGCIWSEYGVDNNDDDGENRDGDENWYQGRTIPFRANAAYSLYGIKRGQLRLRKCTSHTYINSFITTLGADEIFNVLGIGGHGNDDDSGYGNAYCSVEQYYGQDDDDEDGRDLGSGDNEDQSNYRSSTMGCSLTGDRFVMAEFQGGYCEGQYFLNVTDNMRQYNRAMKGVRCAKVFDHSKGFDRSGERVETPADILLANSMECPTTMYEEQCPDPYGIKAAYRRAVSGRSWGWFQTSVRVLSSMALVVGLVLMSTAYIVRHRKRIVNRLFRRGRDKEVGDDENANADSPAHSPERKRSKRGGRSSSKKKSARSPDRSSKSKDRSFKSKRKSSRRGEEKPPAPEAEREEVPHYELL